MSITPGGATELGELLSGDRTTILGRWIDSTVKQLEGRIERSELERDERGLFDAIAAGMAGGAFEAFSPAFDEARALLSELSRRRARQGFSPTETCVAVFALKDALLPSLPEAGRLELFSALAGLVDELGLFSFETYAAAREEIIADQAEQLLELSTPVIKLWEGVVAVPLVGTLDSARTQVVMEKLLESLVSTGSEHAIIDITGVPAVDTQVAQHLLKTVAAARLMGAECIVSGIRPQIAQTMVALGIELGDITTKATLADALLAALSPNERTKLRSPLRS